MDISKTANLVLFPAMGMGHLIPAVGLAKQLVARDSRLSVTFLIMEIPFSDKKLESYLLSLKSNPSIMNKGINFIDLPLLDNFDFSSGNFLNSYLEAFKPKIKQALEEQRVTGPAPLAGLVVDMFCSTMIDVATELELPSYVFFTGGAGVLSMMFHLEELGVDVAAEYDGRPPDTAVELPVFKDPVPLKVLPQIVLNKSSSAAFLSHAKRYRQAKGILVNTFSELEHDFIHFMSENNSIPPVYPAGPILNLDPPDNHGDDTKDPILNWLDEQPPGSVVFLCFGSRGSFEEKQLKEIATGLERTGRRFLWSVRQRPSGGGVMAPTSDIDDLSGVLPDGFLERTSETGRVIGWAPQVKVLGHRAIGAFVSHCGWNSTLESLWFGVPLLTWPLFAEQQFNAFLLVREMGMAAEVRIDYRQDLGEKMVVEALEVEEEIRRVVDEEDERAAMIRKKVKEMSGKARGALMEGGSSYESIGQFIEGVFHNMPPLK